MPVWGDLGWGVIPMIEAPEKFWIIIRADNTSCGPVRLGPDYSPANVGQHRHNQNDHQVQH